MSEKRFNSVHLSSSHSTIGDAQMYEMYEMSNIDDVDKIVALLNSLVDENEQLQNRNQELYDKLQETVGKLGLLVGTEKRLKECKKENKEMRHELDSLSGCYCADNKEFKDYWRIGYDD